jgi:hypothetical protein
VAEVKKAALAAHALRPVVAQASIKKQGNKKFPSAAVRDSGESINRSGVAALVPVHITL